MTLPIVAGWDISMDSTAGTTPISIATGAGDDPIGAHITGDGTIHGSTLGMTAGTVGMILGTEAITDTVITVGDGPIAPTIMEAGADGIHRMEASPIAVVIQERSTMDARPSLTGQEEQRQERSAVPAQEPSAPAPQQRLLRTAYIEMVLREVLTADLAELAARAPAHVRREPIASRLAQAPAAVARLAALAQAVSAVAVASAVVAREASAAVVSVAEAVRVEALAAADKEVNNDSDNNN